MTASAKRAGAWRASAAAASAAPAPGKPGEAKRVTLCGKAGVSRSEKSCDREDTRPVCYPIIVWMSIAGQAARATDVQNRLI